MAEIVKVKDNIYGHIWREEYTRLCPHPSMIKVYGEGGECRVSIYTCQLCRCAIRNRFTSGTVCGYGRGE